MPSKAQNSISGPQYVVSKPWSAANWAARWAMYRESRVNRSWLPPSYTSTKNRAVLCAPSYHGRTANVDGSGSMTMSDSWISLNPCIEEPSSLPTPRLNSSAPRDVDGIVMCCSAPSTSTNWRSIHRIPSVSIRFITDATVIFFDFAGVLAEIAIAFPPGRSHRSVRYHGRNLNIYKLFRREIVRMTGILIENETLFEGPAGPPYTPSTRRSRGAIGWRCPRLLMNWT